MMSRKYSLPLVININFAAQGGPASAPEIIATDWTAVGVKTSSKEVTTDEFRAAQSEVGEKCGLGRPLAPRPRQN